MTVLRAEQRDAIQGATSTELAAMAEDALRRLSPAERRRAARAAGGIGGPSPWVSDWIWLLIVGGFLLTMLVAMNSLVQGRLTPITPTQGAIFTPSETILTLFTTAAAFLAGLLSPSPVKSAGDE